MKTTPQIQQQQQQRQQPDFIEAVWIICITLNMTFFGSSFVRFLFFFRLLVLNENSWDSVAANDYIRTRKKETGKMRQFFMNFSETKGKAKKLTTTIGFFFSVLLLFFVWKKLQVSFQIRVFFCSSSRNMENELHLKIKEILEWEHTKGAKEARKHGQEKSPDNHLPSWKLITQLI